MTTEKSLGAARGEEILKRGIISVFAAFLGVKTREREGEVEKDVGKDRESQGLCVVCLMLWTFYALV